MSSNKINKTNNVNRISFRVDDDLIEKIDAFSKKNKLTKSVLCRNILSDYFLKKKYETIESLTTKLERVMPDLEQHAKEYQAMKEVLKETVNTVYDTVTDIKEMKKGHYLTYKTISNQKESFDKLFTLLGGK